MCKGGIYEGPVVDRVCRLCSVLECFMFLSSLPFMAYNIIGFPGISMGLFSEHGPCLEHDHELLRPIIVSTWMPEKVGGLPGKSLVFAESQVNDFFVFFFSFFLVVKYAGKFIVNAMASVKLQRVNQSSTFSRSFVV